MPVGVIIDSIGTLLGGLLGGLVGKHLPERLRGELNHILGAWAMTLGIALIPKVQVLGAVVISIILAYMIGYALDFDGHVNGLVVKVSGRLFRKLEPEAIGTLSVFIVLTTFGGSGIVGSMTEAISGDRSIILSRAICNTITAVIFGAGIGPVAGLAAVPGFVSLMAFFFCARLIMPLMTDPVFANFTATGGLLTLLSSLRLFGISKAKPMNAVLCIFLVVPVTMLWLSIAS